ncbi:MAG: hypothetical protein LYZ66_03285 [Nitrososphaerales archaeon]|nr:hypothetical protein [Nitrososphaerales archaeon]
MEESLGLAKGDVDPVSVPTELVAAIAQAMEGAEGSVSEEPSLERQVLDVGRDIIESIRDTRGFVLWKKRWPQGARYAACLTHDIDNISRPLSHVLRRRDRFSTSDLILSLLGFRSLYDNASLVAKLEAARSLHSSFYLFSANYDLSSMAKKLRSLLREGWDVGLHGDFGTHDSLEQMLEAFAKFQGATGIRPQGVREHYLRFDFERTWTLMEKAGFQYDSTVGNTDKLGFRVGLCTPFHPPDRDWKPMKILELPLVLMDATLWGYLRRTEAEGVRDFEMLKQRVGEVNGLFTLLWHPEAVRMKGGRTYPAMLDLLLKDGCYIDSGAAVADWWLRRAVPLVLEGDRFRMDQAPAGLVLRFKANGGQTPTVEGGTFGTEGNEAVIKAGGGPLTVAVK